MWSATWLREAVDAVSFSCVLGTRKPHERNYLSVTEELGVDARSCVCVGDGGSQELSGALALGMRPILLGDPRERGNEQPDEAITGPERSSHRLETFSTVSDEKSGGFRYPSPSRVEDITLDVHNGERYIR